jgi:hypothetical protein
LRLVSKTVFKQIIYIANAFSQVKAEDGMMVARRRLAARRRAGMPDTILVGTFEKVKDKIKLKMALS